MSSWGCTKCVKKIISLILSLAICAAMLPAAFAGREDLIFRDARSDFSEEFSNSRITDAQAFGEDVSAGFKIISSIYMCMGIRTKARCHRLRCIAH